MEFIQFIKPIEPRKINQSDKSYRAFVLKEIKKQFNKSSNIRYKKLKSLNLYIVYFNEKTVAYISKKYGQRLYTVNFKNNILMKNCTVRSLHLAKKMVEYFILGENR